MSDLRRHNPLGKGLRDIGSAVVSGAGVEDYRAGRANPPSPRYYPDTETIRSLN